MTSKAPKHKAPKHTHPRHPGLTPFPIAFIFAAQICDLAYYALSHPTTSSFIAKLDSGKHVPNRAFFATTGLAFTQLGIITGLFAIMTGGYDFYRLLQRQAYADKVRRAKDSKDLANRTPLKIKMAFVHALAMDVVVAAMAYNWWTRRGRVAGEPSGLNVVISAVTSTFLLVGANLGGQLVFSQGIGVDLSGMYGKKLE